MNIISKYKDYYDYLMGIYGVDPKLVLDRRDCDIIPYKPSNRTKIQFIIAGNVIDGLYYNDKVYYGEQLREFEYAKKMNFLPSTHNKQASESIYIETNHIYNGAWFSTKMFPDKEHHNDKEDCPILMKSYTFGHDFFKYPILKDWNMGSILAPEEIFLMLSAWLSKKITENEIVNDNRSDEMKLESKGFSKKCSFRPKMKSC